VEGIRTGNACGRTLPVLGVAVDVNLLLTDDSGLRRLPEKARLRAFRKQHALLPLQEQHAPCALPGKNTAPGGASEKRAVRALRRAFRKHSRACPALQKTARLRRSRKQLRLRAFRKSAAPAAASETARLRRFQNKQRALAAFRKQRRPGGLR